MNRAGETFSRGVGGQYFGVSCVCISVGARGWACNSAILRCFGLLGLEPRFPRDLDPVNPTGVSWQVVLFRNQLLPRVLGGCLERRMPGKNGEGTPRKFVWATPCTILWPLLSPASASCSLFSFFDDLGYIHVVMTAGRE